MTLTELGMQYLKEEATLKKRLEQLNKEFKECDDEDKRKSLAGRIYYLRREINDCHEWGEYLISYYADEKEGIAI
ncbi:MAG: hypothetical protein IKT35_05045 [Clostridia bacterium]|nr:hypothetical protein [Clostridia bacterium]